MKSVKQIRNDLEVLSESVESASEMRKLTTLVRAGLFDANKLTMLKRALNKDNVKMTKAERETLLELLDKLLNLVTSNQQVFMKVKQSVSEEVEVLDGSEYQELDEALGGSANDINNIPPLIIMRRRAIRIFPDGQKVALYWADKINKFISVPFESIGISEQTYANLYPDDEKEKITNRNLQLINRLRRQKVNKVIGLKQKNKNKSTLAKIASASGKISSAAGGGLTGAGAAVAGLAGAAVNKGLKKMFAKEEFKARLENKRNLQESQQIDELAPLLPLAGAALATAGRAAIPFIARNAPRALGAGKNIAKNIINRLRGAKSAKKPNSGMSAAEREALKKERIQRRLDRQKPKSLAQRVAAGATGVGAGLVGGASGTDSGSGSERRPESYNRPRYDIDRNVSVRNPYSTFRERQFAQTAISENVLFGKLKTISESNEVYTHQFIDGTVDITPTLATKLLETYSKLNGKNKSSIQEMINKSKNSFIKVAKFSAER